MRPFLLPNEDRGPLRLLCLGAHADDIEIGCGGTILSLIASRPVEVCWVVLAAHGVRRQEALKSAKLFLRGAAGTQVVLKAFSDGFFPYEGAKVKKFFESLKGRFSPDLILTHAREDRHQDHRLVSELTWNTWRDHLILEYEVPKYDGDLGQPNLYVGLTEEQLQEKIRFVLSTFASQRSKHWMTEDTFRGLARIRGIEAGERIRYAEAFYARKGVVSMGLLHG